MWMPKAISEASVFLSIKTSPGLQVASLLKANPSSNFKRENMSANKKHILPKQVERLKFRETWSLHHCRVQFLSKNCPPTFSQSTVQGSRGHRRGAPDLQRGISILAFFWTSSIWGLGALEWTKNVLNSDMLDSDPSPTMWLWPMYINFLRFSFPDNQSNKTTYLAELHKN